ncbi:MAG TPA: indolepyruvate oxidoreductase subunit beta [Acidobacteria bacterium]|nr:indolepyruvate oxidoreductase subunit beta [Acidobacteriota bacterium]
MEKNLILAGVGGQGILSIAFVIDNAALAAGYHFKQAEVHGMSQRGGAVQSHLRYADHPIHSDLIPTGRVDMVLSVEPLEVLRYWNSLSPEGWVVSSITPYINIPDYPEMDELLGELVSFANVVLVDAGKIAQAAGNLRAQNMATLGAAAPLLDFDDEQLLKYVRVLFGAKGEKIVAVNERAFRYGKASGQFFRGLIDGGLAPLDALWITRRMDPATVEAPRAAEWARLLADDAAAREAVLAAGSDLDARVVKVPA